MRKKVLLMFIAVLIAASFGFAGCVFLPREQIKSVSTEKTVELGDSVTHSYDTANISGGDTVDFEIEDPSIAAYDITTKALTGKAIGETNLIFTVRGKKIEVCDVRVVPADKGELQTAISAATKLVKDDYTSESWELFLPQIQAAENAKSDDTPKSQVAQALLILEEEKGKLIKIAYDKVHSDNTYISYNGVKYERIFYTNYDEISSAIVELNGANLPKSSYTKQISALVLTLIRNNFNLINITEDEISLSWLSCLKGDYTKASFELFKTACEELNERSDMDPDEFEMLFLQERDVLVYAIEIGENEVSHGFNTYSSDGIRASSWQAFVAAAASINDDDDYATTTELREYLHAASSLLVKQIVIREDGCTYNGSNVSKANYTDGTWALFVSRCNEINIDNTLVTATEVLEAYADARADLSSRIKIQDTVVTYSGNNYYANRYRPATMEIFKTKCEQINGDLSLTTYIEVLIAFDGIRSDLILLIRFEGEGSDTVCYLDGSGFGGAPYTAGSWAAFVNTCNSINGNDTITNTSLKSAFNTAKDKLVFRIDIKEYGVTYLHSSPAKNFYLASYRAQTAADFKEACAAINENLEIDTKEKLLSALDMAAQDLIFIITFSNNDKNCTFNMQGHNSDPYTAGTWAAFVAECGEINADENLTNDDVVRLYDEARAKRVMIMTNGSGVTYYHDGNYMNSYYDEYYRAETMETFRAACDAINADASLTTKDLLAAALEEAADEHLLLFIKITPTMCQIGPQGYLQNHFSDESWATFRSECKAINDDQTLKGILTVKTLFDEAYDRLIAANR